MIFVYPEIDRVFDVDDGTLNTVIIESQELFRRLLSDLSDRINGGTGKSILSQDDVPVDMSEYAEIVDRFVPFEINRKELLSKVASALEKQANAQENYEQTMKTLRDVEAFLDSLAFDFPCDILFPKLSVSSIIKCASPQLCDDSESLSERLINYMELIYEFDRQKLFITVNMRSFVSDAEAELFARTVIAHGYRVLMLESAERERLSNENRLIIDGDLCEIG